MKVGFGTAFRSQDNDYLLYTDIWRLVSIIKPTGIKPSGGGSLADPYRPLGIGDWFWLSQQEIGEDAIFIKVADRLIAKWGGKAGGLKSYTSDVTEVPEAMFAGDIKDLTKKVREDSESRDAKPGYNPKTETVYTRKAKRVETVYATAATKARELLWGHASGDENAIELANTITGLLISEGGVDRDKSKGGVFMTTFMLLDLIEKHIQYGRQGQFYTWASMLMHAGKDAAQPAPDEIPGRSKKNGLARKIAKHPMAGFDTVKRVRRSIRIAPMKFVIVSSRSRRPGSQIRSPNMTQPATTSTSLSGLRSETSSRAKPKANPKAKSIVT
jgi:hypothetical protein